MGLCNTHRRQQRAGEELRPIKVYKSSNRECSFDGCDKKAHSNDLCVGHYSQYRNGKPLRTLKELRSIKDRYNHEGLRWCTECKRFKPPAEFTYWKYSGDGLSPQCKPCRRWLRLRDKYGVSQDLFSSMLEAQGYGCAICGKADLGDEAQQWHIDHDHSCCPGGSSCGKCVRSILCSNCNTGLGLFKDNTASLKAAIIYLESHGKVSTDINSQALNPRSV
jgi:hypothetical protein